MEIKKEYRENLARLTTLAKENKYKLNSDAERVKSVIERMAKNFMEYGKYFCPCKQSHPLNPEKDTGCPCDQWEAEIKQEGHCFCRLFYKQ